MVTPTGGPGPGCVRRLWCRFYSPGRTCSGAASYSDGIVSRTLIIIGLIIVAIGLLWPWLSKLPLGRLPGDIVVERENFRFYFPITTMIIVSVVASIIVWLFRK